MARIPTLTLDTMNPEQQRIYQGVMQRRGPVQGPLLAAMRQELLSLNAFRRCVRSKDWPGGSM